MGSLWLEQTALRLFPGVVKDQRAAAILAFYASLLTGYLAYAAITVAVAQQVAAVDAVTPKGAVHWRRLGSVLVIATIAPLGTMAGLAAAVIPGMIVWLSWVLAVPVAATTDQGPFAAMRLSARMTWGSRRSLFFLFAAVQLATLVLSAMVAVAMGQPIWAALEDSPPVSAFESILGGLVESLQLAVSGAICCAAYLRLRSTDVHRAMFSSVQ
jgi:hypothetical protein